MGEIDPLEAAKRIVSARFPSAAAAFLSGSAQGPMRTATSDLDIVVFLGEDDQAYRETVRELGWLVELFVQNPWSFSYFVNLETRARRSPLLQMCAHGTTLVSVDGAAEKYQSEARRLLAKGPPPITKGELDQRRYELSDLLDDYVGSTSPEELTFIASQLLIKSSELALLTNLQWLGTGKWLARRLEPTKPEHLARLNAGVRLAVTGDDREPLRSTVIEILDEVGGPLSEGYRNIAPAPPRPTKYKDPR
jgi:hypothetical protein